MLRRRVGDRAFFEGVRDYYRTYRDRTALTEDFQRVMEFHSGQRLDWFFRQWIYQGGHPVYDASWSWDDVSKQLHLRVRQTQPGPLFRVPLDVEIQTGATAKRELVEVDDREETFTFKLDARPAAVRLDPDDWVLKILTLREQ
jgi:aminopeptidase N